MRRYTYAKGDGPTADEISVWEEERSYFSPHPPNPSAPPGNRESKGWGVSADYLPPRDAVAFVVATMKREVANVPQEEELLLEYKYSIWMVCLAHFLWLRTNAGAAWLLRFFGIEEVAPFWDAYSYIYIDPSTQRRILITEDCGIQLRIFDRRERVLNAPITSAKDGTIGVLQDLMRAARDPGARRECPDPQPDMWRWVSEQLRDWFAEPNPNKSWPTNKPNRVSGYQWAKNLERRKGQLFYESLDKVELYKTRAYRLKDQGGGVLWCGPSNMQTQRMEEFYRHQQQLTEPQVEKMFRCSSCDKIRPCLPLTKDHHLCCACYGTQLEKDLRPTLDWCMMRECSGCPSHLPSRNELIQLKNRLNRDVSYPVQRV